jgi:hypothetical protein
MKTARTLIMIIAAFALMPAPARAAAPRQPSEKDSGGNHTTGSRPADRLHGNEEQAPRSHSQMNYNGPATEKRSKTGPMSIQTKGALGFESHQAGPKKAVAALKNGLTVNKTVNHYVQPARLPVGSGTTAPRPGLVASRSTPAAGIGGATAFSAKHPVAVLDGASIKYKP